MTRARDLADRSAVHGRRNLIINGAMQVSQRGTSFTTVDNDYTLDRFRVDEYTDGALDVSQSTDAPDEFSNSLKLDITTADTTISSNYYVIVGQRIEAQNLQHLQYGTSGAKTLTLSFWVKSNKTGTYILEMSHGDATSFNANKWTIDSADTWEKKVITISPDTTNAHNNDNGIGFYVQWWLTAGSGYTSGTHSADTWQTTTANRAAGIDVNIIDSTSNDFYLTGVQLEVGEKATPFEHRSFGEELALCQRYYIKSGDIGTSTEWFAGVATYAGYGGNYAQCIDGNEDRAVVHTKFPVYMRARPTVTYYPARSGVTNTSGSISVYNGNTAVTTSGKPSSHCNGLNGYFSGTSTDSGAYGYQFTADAEL